MGEPYAHPEALVEFDRPIHRPDQDVLAAAQQDISEFDQQIGVGCGSASFGARFGAGFGHPIIVPYRKSATAAGSVERSSIRGEFRRGALRRRRRRRPRSPRG